MSGDLLGNLLRQVSRSFYLSLAILPSALREPIGLAYLLGCMQSMHKSAQNHKRKA